MSDILNYTFDYSTASLEDNTVGALREVVDSGHIGDITDSMLPPEAHADIYDKMAGKPDVLAVEDIHPSNTKFSVLDSWHLDPMDEFATFSIGRESEFARLSISIDPSRMLNGALSEQLARRTEEKRLELAARTFISLMSASEYRHSWVQLIQRCPGFAKYILPEGTAASIGSRDRAKAGDVVSGPAKQVLHRISDFEHDDPGARVFAKRNSRFRHL